MPSASNAGALDGVQGTAEVARVLADALSGGDAEHSLDALLEAADTDPYALGTAGAALGELASAEMQTSLFYSAAHLSLGPVAMEMNLDALAPA